MSWILDAYGTENLEVLELPIDPNSDIDLPFAAHTLELAVYDLQLEAQFDRALTACARAELMELENMTRLLARTAQQMV